MDQVTTIRWTLLVSILTATIGCTGSSDQPGAEKAPGKKGIFGRKTQDVARFDPADAGRVSDNKIRATDPITAPLAAYGPILEQAVIQQIDYALRLFEAAEGRYPKDYDEFMQRIIKENNIQLPVLPYGDSYAYDEKERKLKVLKGTAAAAAEEKKP
jgi:hypothetical protein